MLARAIELGIPAVTPLEIIALPDSMSARYSCKTLKFGGEGENRTHNRNRARISRLALEHAPPI